MAIQYKIKAGDTLNKIAKQYGTSAAELAKANKIQDINMIRAGATLNVPSPMTQGKPVVSPLSANMGGYKESNGFSIGMGGAPTQYALNSASATQLGASPVNTPPAINSISKQNNLAITAGSAIESATDEVKSFAEQQAAKAKAAETAQPNTRQGLLDRLVESVGKIGKQGERTAEIQNEQDVEGKTKALNDINNKILQKERAYEKRSREIQKNTEGRFSGGVDIELARLDKQKSEELADLAIVKAVALGDLDTANSIVQAKVDAEFEPIQNEIDNLKMLLEVNDTMPDREKLALQEEISNREAERDYNYDIRLKQEQAKLEAAANPGGGAGGGGTYATDLDALIGATISSIPTKFGQSTFQANISKARDDADKINLIATMVLKGQPAQIKTDFVSQTVGIKNIDKALAELDKGAQTGVLNNAAQYTYNIAGKDFDPKLTKINSYLTAAIQPYRNSVTGAAWGTQEDDEYKALFGSTKYSPAELRNRLTTLKEILKSKSAEGLNAFVNPLGFYDNQFQAGNFAPAQSGTSGVTSSGLKYTIVQ